MARGNLVISEDSTTSKNIAIFDHSQISSRGLLCNAFLAE